MSRQYIYGNANDKYKRKLFVDSGVNWVEVKARIIEPYVNPTPQPNTKEIKLINAPSHIQQMGIASYKTTLTLMFPDKVSYANYMAYIGHGHKFYDERGQIYVGAVESVKTTSIEGHKRYKVEVTLVLVKKAENERGRKDAHQFVDVDFSDKNPTLRGWKDLDDMIRHGVVNLYERDGTPILYFRPWQTLTRSEFAVWLMRTKKLIEQAVTR